MIFPSPDRRRCAGFTLIELLVVVAIIAMLISILLPALGGARKQGRQLVCATNLRSQGEAAFFYAQANRDWMIRGLADYPNREYTTYVLTILPGLNWDGQLKGLWSVEHQSKLIDICRRVPQLQCPDHPVKKQYLDYVSSAFPIPYTDAMVNYDVRGGGRNGDHWRGEYPPNYIGAFRISDFHSIASPGRIVYVTEGHKSLATDEIRFHHFFLTSQLPFGAFPRIASDRRHPIGINALFFDNHVKTMPLSSIDSGWPNTLGHRLRWFTIAPPKYR